MRRSIIAVLVMSGVAISGFAPVVLLAQETAPTTQVGMGSVEEWRQGVWSAALAGDNKSLVSYFDDVPETTRGEDASELRKFIEAYRMHRTEAAIDRTEDRDQAREKMEEFAAEGKIVEALSKAVELQTLSDDWELVLHDVEIQDLISRGDAAQKEARAEGDWLFAQDLLYRLRTLNEDVGQLEEYNRYDVLLDDVNRRIGLLAQYARRTLHELRRIEVARYAPEEEFPEFNDAFDDDWKELLKDVNDRVLKRALGMAARDHISGSGWKPLLKGGLEALRIFVTTNALQENFPSLSNQEQVNRFDAFLEIHEDRIWDMPDDSITPETCRRLLDEIALANKRTVQLDKEVLIREFGDGAMYELERQFHDEYSSVIWPDQLRRFHQQVNGAFVGVGILIRHDERRRILVVNPLEGSPAARSGVKAGDVIVGVNKSATVGWSLNRAVDEITGPVGEDVTLKLAREGEEESVEIVVTRDEIKMRSVNGWWKNDLSDNGEPEWDWFIDPEGGVGYVRLTSFNEDSYGDFLVAIDEMRTSQELKGLILDLRHNPGGLLRSAVEFTNLFVENGAIVAGEDRNRRQVWELKAQPGRALLKGLPTVILVNQGSASASEIVAGAVQAHGSAVVLGERSYGKGSVQTVHDLSSPFSQAAVKLTTQYYVLPPRSDEERGRLVHKKPGAKDWGVNPDIVVEVSPEQIENMLSLRHKADLIEEWIVKEERVPRPSVAPLIHDGQDPQMEMALLLLKAHSLGTDERGHLAAERN